MTIDKTSHIPLYLQLENLLKKEIAKGTWGEEGQIPTEQMLMAQYQLGRMTVRTAIEDLQNQGLVEKRHGYGTFVAKEKNLSGAFAPFISLSFNMRQMGLEETNRILGEEEIVTDGAFAERHHTKAGRKLLSIKRLRLSQGKPVAIEQDYLEESLSEGLTLSDKKNSLVAFLVTKAKLDIRRFDQSVVLRTADAEEMERLSLKEGEEVLSMDRSLYAKGEDEPCFFVHFVANAKLVAKQIAP